MTGHAVPGTPRDNIIAQNCSRLVGDICLLAILCGRYIHTDREIIEWKWPATVFMARLKDKADKTALVTDYRHT